MAGIIQDAQQTEAPPEEGGARQMTPAKARQSMPIPPGQQDAYAKVVAAGKKILYSPQMDGEIANLLNGEGDTGDKLGLGVFALVSLLLSQSNGTLPAELLIPAGCELVTEAADMLDEQGVKVSDKDIAKGATVFVRQVMQKAGIDEAQLQQAFGGQGAPAPEAPPETDATGRPADEEVEPETEDEED